MLNDVDRLDRLILGGHPCIRLRSFEEDEALEVIRAASMGAQRDLHLWTIVDGLRDGLMADSRPVNDTTNPAAALYQMARTREPSVFCTLDLAAHLDDPHVMRALRRLITRCAVKGSSVILVDHADRLPPVVEAHSTPFELSLPNEEQIESLIRATLRTAHRERPVTADLSRRDLAIITKNLRGLTKRQAQQIIRDSIAEDRTFDADDVNHILAGKRALMASSGTLEFVESPATLDDIGGLTRLKSWLDHRRNAFSEEAKSFGLTAPRGVLMLGVQGAGKSLCAKAIATAWSCPLLRLDPGALYDRYVGESEKRLRDALHQAEMMSPIVLWIDEIEKAFASAASRSTDGGLSQRMFGTLLTWMQDHRAPVFLVATANDIEALPPELLRKGRFDEIFFVDLPGADARRCIFEIHLRRRDRDPSGFDLDALVEASDGFSGAEIEQAIIGGLHDAFASSSDLTDQHLQAVLAESPPLSVTMRERIDALRRWAQDRCVSAD